MPLTEEQKAAITTLASAEADEVAEALKNDANPIYNKVFGAGVTTGKAQVNGKLTTAETELQTAKEEVERLTGEIDALKEKQPDRAEIDSEWQKRLDREVKKVQDQLEAANSKVARLTTDTTAEKAENALLAAGFRPRLAKLLAKDGASRIKFDDDGKPVLYDAASNTPIQLPADKSPFEALAEEEKAKADPADLLSGVDSGGGAGSGAGGGSGYDPAKEGKRMAEEAKASSDNKLAFQ